MGNRRLAQVATTDEEEENAPPPPPSGCEDEEEEGEEIVGKPLGEVVRVSGKGRNRRKHYASFEYDDLQFQLEDSVLLAPQDGKLKPAVAIIKDITQTHGGQLMVMTQYFYRPEDIEKEGCGNWQPTDNRELFYSFHKDESTAESVMHKCVVHFIPQNKQLPHRKAHPGFIVQRVYDTVHKRLNNFSDKDYEGNNLDEIDLLLQKTLALIGELPDLEEEPEDAARKIDGLCRSESRKTETPAGSVSDYAILSKFKLLTGETQRDKWLEKLLQSVQFICANRSQDKIPSGDAAFDWPDAAVPAVAALEKAAHDTFSSDFQKYNQKMRQLTYNLKGNAALARRLLNKELQPAQILSMSPNELKEGLTAEEIASREPEESGHKQMTDARCRRCHEKQVALIDVIQAGHGDRYQLECIACGNTWYASRDEAPTLSKEGPSSNDVEKNAVSPRVAPDSNDVLKKTTEKLSLLLEKES